VVYAADPFLSAERITSFVGDVSLVRLELQQVSGLGIVGREDNSWRIDRLVCVVVKPDRGKLTVLLGNRQASV
jgi:hypothetical protein